VKFETIMKMNLKITVLWNAMLRTVTSRYQRFEIIFCLRFRELKIFPAEICYLPNQLKNTALGGSHRLKRYWWFGVMRQKRREH